LRLAAAELAQGEPSLALGHLRSLLAIEPLHEAAHRMTMEALAVGGRRDEALRQFERLCRALGSQLGVRPEAETVRLFQRVKGAAPSLKVMAHPGPGHGSRSLPAARPGLVVVPLRHQAGSQDDADLADALTEELIASLAPYRWFFVISTLQALVYRNRRPSPADLAAELGVRYVVEGRVRRDGSRLSLRLMLSETERGEHLWSEQIACHLDDVLLAQDQLARHVANLIEPELVHHEAVRAERRRPENVASWVLAARARRLTDLCRTGDLAQARALARDAIEREPESAFGHASLAWSSWMSYVLLERDRSFLPEALEAAERAVTLDHHYYLGFVAQGASRNATSDLQEAAVSLRRAIDLNPSFPTAFNQLLVCLTKQGRPFEALRYIEPLDLVSPHDPFHGFYRCARALTYFFAGDDEAAIENARLSLSSHPGWFTSEIVLIAASGRSGDIESRDEAAKAFVERRGTLTAESLHARLRLSSDRDRQELDCRLREAGVLCG
jgi:TolB-like protein